MSGQWRDVPRTLTAVEAGDVLGLPADVVRVLADAGYLAPASMAGGVPRFALGDLKAFQARTAADATYEVDIDDGLDADTLLALLDGRAGDIAERALDLLAVFLPEVRDFSDAQRQRFLTEARDRIEAILAVCAHGPGSDDAIERDLADIGADAAHHGVALPAVLVALRTTRDLVVQTAVELAEERGRRWGLALSVTLTRVIPAIDRLSDAVARGYWDAVLEIEAEGIDRFRNVVDRVADGIFTLDADGVVTYANGALASLLATPVDELPGRSALDVLGIDAGSDGRIGSLVVRQFERVREGVVVGWDGVVRPGEGGLRSGEDAAAAPGVVDEGDRLGDDPLGDRPERVGGWAVTEGDGGAGVPAEGDGGLEGDTPE